MSGFFLHPATIVAILHGLILVGVSVRVVMTRPATGVALAWLLLVASLPGFGALLYLLIGERRIGRTRTHAIGRLRVDMTRIVQAAMQEGLTDVDWSQLDSAAQAMDALGRNLVGYPTVRGSSFELKTDTEEILREIASDVDAATKSVLMEFYIWHEGGAADAVLEAVMRAAGRGVRCRVLIDALGARPWWKGEQPARLRAAGVELRAALPVGVFRTFVGRTDLRLHRKIVVVDGDVAWTGSMNLVDPRFFKQDAGVGEWVDAMVRLQGAVIVPLAVTAIADWVVESGELLEQLIVDAELTLVDSAGPVDIQVVPSGPGETGDGLIQMVLTLINAARSELILTTPYLVPDDSLLRALRGAAARGVEVSLIIPEKVDSMLTRYASRSYYEDLLDVGVAVYLYQGGLLHTKSITADGRMSMFGTVNLDMRSLWLNYEVSLFVYQADFATQLRTVQQAYIAASRRLDQVAWTSRPVRTRFVENVLRLVSPLL